MCCGNWWRRRELERRTPIRREGEMNSDEPCQRPALQSNQRSVALGLRWSASPDFAMLRSCPGHREPSANICANLLRGRIKRSVRLQMKRRHWASLAGMSAVICRIAIIPVSFNSSRFALPIPCQLHVAVSGNICSRLKMNGRSARGLRSILIAELVNVICAIRKSPKLPKTPCFIFITNATDCSLGA